MRTLTKLHSSLLVAVAIIVAGCGGGGGGSSSNGSARGAASLTIHWPTSTRLVPSDAQSIEITMTGPSSPAITLTNGTNFVTSPGSGLTSTVTTVQVVPGAYTITASAFPGTTPTSGGNAEATGSASVTISSGSTTNFSISMASTIDHVEVTANGATIEVSTSGAVTPGNGGSATSLPLAPTLLNTVTVLPKNSTSDNLVLFPLTLTGNELTNTDGKLVVAGAASALSNTSGSLLTANVIANASAMSAYTSAFKVTYSESGSVINTFTVPVSMAQFSVGAASQLTVDPSWTTINAVTQPTATQYVMVAFNQSSSTTSMTETIQDNYSLALVTIGASHAVAFLDLQDGYWLTNTPDLFAFNFGGLLNNGPNGLTGPLLLANDVPANGLPFLITSAGAYQFGTTTPVTNSAIASATQFAVSAGPGAGYTFWTINGASTPSSSTEAGVLTAYGSSGTMSAIAGSATSPLLYALQAGSGSPTPYTLQAIAPGTGVVIGTASISSIALQSLTGLAVFVNPATGKVDGTATGAVNSTTPAAFAF